MSASLHPSGLNVHMYVLLDRIRSYCLQCLWNAGSASASMLACYWGPVRSHCRVHRCCLSNAPPSWPAYASIPGSPPAVQDFVTVATSLYADELPSISKKAQSTFNDPELKCHFRTEISTTGPSYGYLLGRHALSPDSVQEKWP